MSFQLLLNPNGPIACWLESFNGFLNQLDQANHLDQRTDETLLVAGDFNAKSKYWGSDCDDAKREALYVRGTSTSVIDVTFSGPGPLEVMNWKVLEDYSVSDHNYIHFDLDKTDNLANEPRFDSVTLDGLSGSWTPMP